MKQLNLYEGIDSTVENMTQDDKWDFGDFKIDEKWWISCEGDGLGKGLL